MQESVGSIWSLSNRSEKRRLEREFKKLGILTVLPGFYDDPAFIKQEQIDPYILNKYAHLVESKNYDGKYLEFARNSIEIVAEVMSSVVSDDGRQGACVDASGIVGRMLDELQIWNYVAKATLTVVFDSKTGLTPKHFWDLDDGEFAAAHAFVVAPPFGVIDVTVSNQHWNDTQKSCLPHLVMADSWAIPKWDISDIANDRIQLYLKANRIPPKQYLAQTNPQMLEVLSVLKPRLIVTDSVSLKYIPVAVGGFMEKLDGISNYKPTGMSALELFEEMVLPRIT